MSGMDKVLKKFLSKEHIVCAIQNALPGGEQGPAVEMINAEIVGFIPALAENLGTQSQFGYDGTFGYDTDLYPVVPEILAPISQACGTGSNETSVIGTLVIDPKLPPGSADVFDLTIIPLDISAGMGSVILFCPDTGQYTAPQGSYGGTVGQVRTISGLDASSLDCDIEDVLVGFLAFGANGNANYEGNCDEISAEVGTIVAITPSACKPARECFKAIFGCYPEEMAELEESLSEDDINNLIGDYLEQNNIGEDTDDQTLSTTVAGGVTTQIAISEGNVIDILHPEHICPEQMTRSQLLALRNAGNLDMSCHYLITDTGNGCLGDVVIELHPVSTDRLSDNVSIHTTHDTEAWSGKYDISENQIEQLEDNRGNRVRGDTQAEVNAFPWGNANWLDNTVENALVQVECDTALQVRNTKFDKDSRTDLRGATGYLRASDIGEGAIVQFNGSAIQVSQLTADSRARLYGNTATAVRILSTHMDSDAYWIFNGRDDVRATYVHMSSASRVYFTDGVRQWLNNVEIGSFAHIRQFAGTLQMYYSHLSSYAEYRHEAGAGVALIYGLDMGSRGYYRNFNTAQHRSYYERLDSRGEIVVRGAVNKTHYYNHIDSYGILTNQDAATTIYGMHISSNARFTATGGNHYRNRFGAYARVTSAFNTRNIYADGSFAQTLSAANSNTYRGFGISTLV